MEPMTKKARGIDRFIEEYCEQKTGPSVPFDECAPVQLAPLELIDHFVASERIDTFNQPMKKIDLIDTTVFHVNTVTYSSVVTQSRPFRFVALDFKNFL